MGKRNFLNNEDITNLNVRNKKQLSKDEIKKIELAGLDAFNNLEAWSAIGSNQKLAYSTHNAVRFFGKFPPPIATYLINKYSDKNSFVVDTMGGSGTTAVECLLHERACLNSDINPFMILLAKVKTNKLNEKKIDDIFLKIKKQYGPSSFQKNKNNFSGIKNLDHWFLKETQDSLMGLKKEILKIDNKKYQDFFLVCFLSIIRRVSRATSQQGRLFLDVETAERNVFPFFEKKVLAFKQRVAKLPSKKAKIQIIKHNIKKDTIAKYKNKADLVILHPPYFNSYKYSSVMSLEAFWMGIDHANVRPEEVKEFFKIGKPEKHKIFIEDMIRVLNNSLEVVANGGHLALMIGDAFIKGNYIQIVKPLIESLDKQMYQIQTIAIRVPKYTEASWASSQRRSGEKLGINLNDFIVVIKKQ